MVPRSTVDPWPCQKGHESESESDRRADGAKSNAATVAMSSTILFKTAITNCRALLLYYDDGWGRHAIEDYEEGWGGMSETRLGYYSRGLENGVHSSESDSQFRTVQRYNTRCISLRPSEITMSSFKPYSYPHFIFTKSIFRSTPVEA